MVPVDVAAFLLNEKRSAVNDIESSTDVRVLIIPNPHMETPHFEVIRLRDDEVEETSALSYEVEIEAPDPVAIRDEESAAPSPSLWSGCNSHRPGTGGQRTRTCAGEPRDPACG